MLQVTNPMLPVMDSSDMQSLPTKHQLVSLPSLCARGRLQNAMLPVTASSQTCMSEWLPENEENVSGKDQSDGSEE